MEWTELNPDGAICRQTTIDGMRVDLNNWTGNGWQLCLPATEIYHADHALLQALAPEAARIMAQAHADIAALLADEVAR